MIKLYVTRQYVSNLCLVFSAAEVIVAILTWEAEEVDVDVPIVGGW